MVGEDKYGLEAWVRSKECVASSQKSLQGVDLEHLIENEAAASGGASISSMLLQRNEADLGGD